MARIPMVTRTIVTTKATVLCVDLESQTPFEKEVVLPRTYKNDSEMLKVAESIINTETVKAVHIKSSSLEETLYGMTETDFVNNDKVKILPPRTKVETPKEE